MTTKQPRKSIKPKEADDATAPEAVAEAPTGDSAAVVLPLSDEEQRHIADHVIPARVAASSNDAPTPLAGDHCSECFETDDLMTVGEGDAAREYCRRHRPLNA